MAEDFITRDDLSLFTSQGRFTTCVMYYHAGMQDDVATFDLFIRDMPPTRNYLVFCGLEHIVDYLRHLHFTPAQMRFLQGSTGTSGPAYEYFKNFRFTGDVYAMPEGTLCFANEPLIRITAPIIEAAHIEQYLMNTVMLQTMLASKLVRVVRAARDTEIGLTFARSHGLDAAIKSVRVATIVGVQQCGSLLSAYHYKLPAVGGTTFHHFFSAFDREEDAFAIYAKYNTGRGLVLVDTYDTMNGIRKVIEACKKYGKHAFKGISLDSGDLVVISKKARRMLDEAGLQHLKIMAMSNLDEYRIDTMERQHAPVDLYGLATEVLTSPDAPKLEVVYKLSEIVRGRRVIPKMKLSSKKISLPGRKQVYRVVHGGKYVRDVIGLEREHGIGEPLLEPIMKHGKLVRRMPSISEIHAYYVRASEKFDPRLFSVKQHINYPVKISSQLQRLVCSTKKTIWREN